MEGEAWGEARCSDLGKQGIPGAGGKEVTDALAQGQGSSVQACTQVSKDPAREWRGQAVGLASTQESSREDPTQETETGCLWWGRRSEGQGLPGDREV